MANFEVEIHLPPDKKFVSDLGFGETLNLYTASIVRDYIDKYVPYRTGATSVTAKVTADDKLGYITYDTPYVGYIYNGEHYNFRKDVHLLARAKWDEGLTEPELNEIVKKVSKERRRLAREQK